MSVAAREVWDEMAPELIRLKLLTIVDVKQFAEYCEATIIAQTARVLIYRMMTGEIQLKAGAANPFNSYARAVQTMMMLASRFGLTPADRARLTVDRDISTDDLISGAG